jgi:2-hydroxychromene-2-carboxylate isomerase
MATVEFFFDCSSPWTYLGFHRMEQLSDELRQPVVWRPFLLGGVFNTVNPSVYRSREAPVPAKQAYMAKDMADWARHYGLAIRWPQPIFPINSVKAMRACFHAEAAGRLVPFARAVFEAYWGRALDISQDAVLADAASAAGLDPAAMLTAAAAGEAKAKLRANTDELIARGGFGSPTVFVDQADMYFGNDRLDLVGAAVRRSRQPR